MDLNTVIFSIVCLAATFALAMTFSLTFRLSRLESLVQRLAVQAGIATEDDEEDFKAFYRGRS